MFAHKAGSFQKPLVFRRFQGGQKGTLERKVLSSLLLISYLTLFFPMFPFDPPENVWKPKVFWRFQGDRKGTLEKKGLFWSIWNLIGSACSINPFYVTSLFPYSRNLRFSICKWHAKRLVAWNGSRVLWKLTLNESFLLQ